MPLGKAVKVILSTFSFKTKANVILFREFSMCGWRQIGTALEGGRSVVQERTEQNSTGLFHTIPNFASACTENPVC